MNALPPLDMDAVVRQALQGKATTDQDTGKPRAGACAATEDQVTMKPIEQLVNRFLTWPVPADCHPDGTPGQPGRTGTNLLTAAQAKAMLEHVLATDAAPADALEADIQARASVAPRVKPAEVEAEIVGETYTVLPSGRVTVCELTLRNGFTVRGESAVVFIENFDAEIGRKVARFNAVSNVWQLLGFRLRDERAAADRV
jgi:hypothetical protein